MVAEILLTPSRLIQKIPLDSSLQNKIARARHTIINILNKNDKRLLVIIGPCSIHDPKAALDYAQRLKKLATSVEQELFLVMRVYLEKPRTTTGWQGLIKDPNLDSSFDINRGLTLARELLQAINSLDLPAATEFLDPFLTPYIADLISWGAIGARTCESQIHRNLASGLQIPIGFKNSTSGASKTAVDALTAASQANYCISLIDDQAGIQRTQGNQNTHVVLRGGNATGPNYNNQYITHVCALLNQQQLPERLMIDCSHANSQGDYTQQAEVINSVATQLDQSHGDKIIGLMLESFIESGKQCLSPNLKSLEYGKSITDGCISWPETENIILSLASKVKQTRFEHNLLLDKAAV